MRFKEFFIEATLVKQQDLQPGYSLFTIPGGDTVQIPTSVRQKYNDAAILDLLKKQGYPVPNAPATQPAPGQGASITPATAQLPAEPPPQGYRFYKLPNGDDVAVPQQLDDKQAFELIKRKRPDLLGKQAPKTKTKGARVIIPADLPPLPAVDEQLMATAKQSADEFLGRVMTPKEWDHLIRATFAESSHDITEDAWIMATILNRARSGGFGGSDVSSVLSSPNQFQSVSGVPGKRVQSPHFTQGPPGDYLTKLLTAATSILPKVPKDLVNFTAADPKAYGKGTDPSFLRKLKKSGGRLVGKTIFGKLG